MRRRAFTLVEILVASVIGTLVAGTAVVTLRTITAGREKLDRHTALAAELRYAAATLQNDLQNLYRDIDSKNSPFVGDCTEDDDDEDAPIHLRFYTTRRANARPGSAESDVYEVEYFLKRRSDEEEQDSLEESPQSQSVLMRRVWPNPSNQRDPGGLIGPLASDIIVFQARYFDGIEWLDVWAEERGSIPKAVEILLVAQAPDGKETLRRTILVNFPRWPEKQK